VLAAIRPWRCHHVAVSFGSRVSAVAFGSTQCCASGSGRCGRSTRFAGAFVALRLPFVVRRVKLPSALAAIDLSGYKPLLIGLAAGVGEELLFRAALLPLLGLWVSSALFAVAHLRTAQLAATRGQRVAYIANTFAAGVVLGLVFVHVGLLAAIGVHAIIDIVGLSAMQRLKGLRGAAAAT